MIFLYRQDVSGKIDIRSFSNEIMIRKLLIICMLSFLGACSTIDKNAPISNIKTEYSGKNKADRPDMVSVCKGFILSEQQIIEFYMNAETIHSPDQMAKADVLPCFSSGIAYLYGVKHQWTILYGGIGVFTDGKETFYKVCGKNCCKKVHGVC